MEILTLKVMRAYILTEKERKILETFLDSDVKLNGFSVLILRLKKAQSKLEKDLKMVNLVLQKIEQTH
jgi:hypothetical protein